jgi:glycosyltransferase involved in cell wall biosynthesis
MCFFAYRCITQLLSAIGRLRCTENSPYLYHMQILIVEPFFTGSHAVWAEEYQRFSRHAVQILHMSGHHWKWRMHGGAVTLARQVKESGLKPDLLLASDMLDLTTFLALTRHALPGLKAGLYFHENQLTYPRSARDTDRVAKRDNHYAFINYTSALAADRVFFNSPFHQQAFHTALEGFLRSFPDHQEITTLAPLRAKSEVLPLGMDLQALDQARPAETDSRARPPLILWNHRWEHDKNPDAFFEALFALHARGLPFELAVLGQAYQKSPAIFARAREVLADRIVHWGHADRDEYIRWLWRADLLPVTSRHDFFGRSVVEAMYCGCYPLLPDRLAYPSHIPQDLHETFLYGEPAELEQKLADLLQQGIPPAPPALRDQVSAYDWQHLAAQYDNVLAVCGRENE